MKLINRLMLNMTIVLTIGLSVWSIVFYYSVKKRLVKELDTTLLQVSEDMIQRYLAGEYIPDEKTDGTYTFHFIPVPESYKNTNSTLLFSDGERLVDNSGKKQPVRILQTLFHTHDNGSVVLQTITPLTYIQNLRSAILQGICILYITLLFLILLIYFVVTQFNMKPLYNLLEWMKHFDLKHNNTPITNDTNVTEFRLLNEAANLHVERMKNLYEQQRQFIDNAAHEMQTPLAVCLNYIEHIQQNENIPEEIQENISKLQRPLRRLVKLHKDLLQLTRIENGVYEDSVHVDIAALIHSTCSDLSEIFAHKRIDWQVNGKNPLHIEMNETLAHQLIGNLLRNAWLHTPEHGKIIVTWTNQEIVFANNGLFALDDKRIFERFYQRERKENSNGLGLAICSSICNQYNFSLTYEFKEEMHFFRIGLK